MKTPPIANVYAFPRSPESAPDPFDRFMRVSRQYVTGERTPIVSIESRRALAVMEHALEDHPATFTALRMLAERLSRGGEPVEVIFMTGAGPQKFIAADMLARAVSGQRPQLKLQGAALMTEPRLANSGEARAFICVEGAPSPALLKRLVDHLQRTAGPAGVAVVIDVAAGRDALPPLAAAIDPGALAPKTPLGWTEIHFG